MENEAVSLKEYCDIKISHLNEIINLKTEHLKEIGELTRKFSENAINKAENSLFERMESSNNKYQLLKEQSAEFATKTDMKAINEKIDLIMKIIYIGSGVLLALQIALQYFFKMK